MAIEAFISPSARRRRVFVLSDLDIAMNLDHEGVQLPGEAA